MSRLDASRSALVVIDLQEKLVPAIANGEAVVSRAGILLAAAGRMSVPAIVTEHFPDKIGGTLDALKSVLGGATIFAKTHFSATDEPGFLDLLAQTGRDQILICGTEAHVCVLQTAFGIAETGRQTFVVTDASGSRSHTDRDAAYQRLAMSNVVPVTSEMIVFEWTKSGNDPAFRDLHKLIK